MVTIKRPSPQPDDLPPPPTEKKPKKDKKEKIKRMPLKLKANDIPPPTPTTTTAPPLPPVSPMPTTTSSSSSSSGTTTPLDMDGLFNGDILKLLNPPAATYQIQLPPMEQACQPLICPMHKTDLTCFQAQTTGDTYVKCQESQYGIFCHQDQIVTYLKLINEKLHPDYLKRTLVCDCEEPVVLRISRSQANPNRPYFTCKEIPEDRCPFFQWADKPLKPKNQKKQRQDK